MSPEPEPTLSRRSAITQGLRLCEEIALLSSWAVHGLFHLKQSQPIPLHTIGYTPNITHRLINQFHHNPQRGYIHNLGVIHVEPFFHQHKEFFVQVITDCDALLFEGNPFSYYEYQHPLAARFFDRCYDVAVARQKTIYFIDQLRTPLIFYQGNFALPLTAISALAMNVDTLLELKNSSHSSQQNSPSPLPLFSTRRNMLRALAGLGLGSAWVMRMPDTDNPHEYDGYIERGRSAIMMRNIRTVAHAAPSAKLLTITGNVHAQLFEHYLADPTLLKRDLHDYRIHDAIYSLPMEKMEPGDHDLSPVVPG